MPGYRTHIVGGIITSMTILGFLAYGFGMHFTFSTTEFSVILLSSSAGALFPDIDTKSKGHYYFYLLMGVFVVYSIIHKYWSLLSGLSLISIFPSLFVHRGITHQVWFVVLAPLSVPYFTHLWNKPLYPLAKVGYCFFVIGALSHLLLDFGPRNFMRRGFFGSSAYNKRKRR